MTSMVMLLFSAPVGSSANRMAGSQASARQIDARCSCPPDTWVIPWVPTCAMPNRSIRARTRAVAPALSLGLAFSAGNKMLSAMVRLASR